MKCKLLKTPDLLTEEEITAICHEGWKLICVTPILPVADMGGWICRYAYYFGKD